MEQLNSFEQGLNKDLSKGALKSSMYTDARNWHLITEEGSSTIALENVKGNRLYSTFPTTSPVYKITIGSFPYRVGNPGIIASPYIYKNFPNPGVNTELAFNEALADWIMNENSVFTAVGTDEGVLVYSTTLTSFSFSTTGLTTTLEVASQANLRPIGWTTMRNDFIILTTNSLTGGPGQIWKLSYDATTLDTTYVNTLTLLYNNNINFAIEHPVASPGAIVGRYENINIQNIYWTDFFNNPRKFNTVDPKGFGILPINLRMFPTVDMSIPILSEITLGGRLETGIYQYSYRLSTSSGQSTAFSSLSNIIPITDVDENSGLTDLRNYDGAGLLDVNNIAIVTSKKIKCIIRGIDTDYTKIEVIYLYRGSNADLPTIRSFLRDEPVPSDGIFTFEHTRREVEVSVTLDDFVSFKGNLIDLCKTMTTKDNVLLVGNMRESALDVDYDARVRRYNSSQQSYQIGTNDGDEDDINPNQDFNTSNAYIYQSDGITVGGTGVNISYEIKQAKMLYDQYYVGDGRDVNNTNWDSIAAIGETQNPPRTPFRSTNKNSHNHNLGIPDQTYYQGWFFDTFISPYNHGLFKGYKRDETYRFGILFYDKRGNPGFVKWTGDIRMPRIFDFNKNEKFPLVRVYDSEQNMKDGIDFHNIPHLGNFFHRTDTDQKIPWTSTHPLYLRMTVNIPSNIRDQIGGFSIVRAERTQSDKSILSQGIIFPIGYHSGHSRYISSNLNLINNSVKGFTAFFPEHFFNDDLTFVSGDKIRFAGVLAATVRQPISTLNTFELGAVIAKLYDLTILKTSTIESNINQFSPLSLGEDGLTVPDYLNVSPSRTFSNTGTVLDNDNIPQSIDTKVLNQKCIFLDLDQSFSDIVHYNFMTGGILVDYIRENSNQYGGNTVSQRSQTKYISCGHFQPINSNSPSSFTFDVYGGDIFTPVWDFQRSVRVDVDPILVELNDFGFHISYFVPIETTIDIDTRQGVTTNRSGFVEQTAANITNRIVFANNELFDLTRPQAGIEDIVAHGYYDFENSVKKFTSKPVDFILSKEFDNRIRASEAKTNGEVDDNWTNFDPIKLIDVDGVYGPINNLVPFRDNILYFQTNAFGQLIVNPRAIVPDVQGDELQMATGSVLEDYRYISNEIGCFHQWGMITSDTSIFFWDSKRKKIYQFGEGIKPLSDLKGLQAFFANELGGDINILDNPLISGVCATYDYRFNEAIFTFKDRRSIIYGKVQSIEFPYVWITDLPLSFINTLKVGDTLNIDNPGCGSASIITEIETDRIRVAFRGCISLGTGSTVRITIIATLKTTIAFSEQMNAFSSFYDFVPDMYLNDRRIVLTPKPGEEKKFYLHNKFDYNNFYGTLYPSTIDLTINPAFKETKTFDNLEWFTEVTKNDIDSLDTFNKLKCKTGYQEGSLTLVNNDTVKRRERTWSTQVPRGQERERLRDKYMDIKLTFDNPDNKRILFHYLNTFFRQSLT